MNAKQLEPKYTLFESLEEMLAPTTLSELLSQSVTHVDGQPMDKHNGMSGGQMSYVNTDAGQLVLKQMSMEHDWSIYVSDDRKCRSVRLWQYGLLDELRPDLEHKIIACAQNDSGWGILMHDLTEGVFGYSKNAIPQAFLPVFIEKMARLHASFWNNSRLQDSCLGLCDVKNWIKSTSLSFAQKQNGDHRYALPSLIITGWDAMEKLVDPDVFQYMKNLHDHPQPLISALSRYPYTLIHNDFQSGNLAYLNPDQAVIFDWQLATRTLMSIDLTRFIDQSYALDVEGQAQAIRYYRGCLEAYLHKDFDDMTWQVMTDLGYLANALVITCGLASFSILAKDPELRRINERRVKASNQRVRDGMRWL